jgi:hypothetical protein
MAAGYVGFRQRAMARKQGAYILCRFIRLAFRTAHFSNNNGHFPPVLIGRFDAQKSSGATSGATFCKERRKGVSRPRRRKNRTVPQFCETLTRSLPALPVISDERLGAGLGVSMRPRDVGSADSQPPPCQYPVIDLLHALANATLGLKETAPARGRLRPF